MEETTPLVSNPPSASRIKTSAHPQRSRAFTVILLIAILCTLSVTISGSAQARIFESIYCIKWYREHNPTLIEHGTVEEQHCKIPRVQSQVASLAGWKGLFEAIPGLFLAIPFGILSDRFGRKWLVLSCYISALSRMSFTVLICLLGETVDLRVVWLGSIFNLFSGGDTVAGILDAIILTDVTPREQLSKPFFYITAAMFACFIVGPIIGASLMKVNDWIPVWIGLLLQALVVPSALFLPETLDAANKTSNQSRARAANGGAEYLSDTINAGQADNFDQLRKIILSSLADLYRVFSDWRILFLAGLNPTRMMTIALEYLQPRYVSYRYHWTIASATYLYSLQAVGGTIMLLLLLPRFSDVLRTRWYLTAIQSAALIGEMSLGVSALGSAVEGIAPTVPLLIIGIMIQTLSVGAPAAFRALAGSLAEPEDTGKVFTGLAIVESLSGMAAFPIIAGLYNLGIERGGGAWLGLPFDVTAVVKGTLTIIMCMLRFER